MAERDPRVDPQPGDVLELLGIGRREVKESTHPKTKVIFHLCCEGNDFVTLEECTKDSWRKWARGATVVRRKEEG